MIDRFNPIHILLFAFFLLLIGVVLPFLMVIHVIESTFFLNFFAYGSSTLGLMLGVVGIGMYSRKGRKK